MNFSQGSKYHNKKVEVDGIVFDSQREVRVYEDLKREKAAGNIKGFDRQVKFVLIPAQRETVHVTDEKGRIKEKQKVVELAVTYVADFVVEHLNGTKTVVDAKGTKDMKYPIKRKLMRYVHGLVIMEV